MATQRLKKPKTRISLDLSAGDIERVNKLEKIYDADSHAKVIRTAIQHELKLIEFIKAGGKIQHLKENGDVETLAFIEWMPLI